MKKSLLWVLDAFCFIAENLSVVGGLGLLAMMIITATDVFLRLFSKSVLGSMELISYLMCVVVFLSFGRATFIESYTKVELFSFGKSEPVIRAIIDVIHTGVCAFTSYFCFVQSAVTRDMGTVSQMLKIPRWPFLTLSGAGFLLIAVSVPLLRYRNYRLKAKESLRAAEI